MFARVANVSRVANVAGVANVCPNWQTEKKGVRDKAKPSLSLIMISFYFRRYFATIVFVPLIVSIVRKQTSMEADPVRGFRLSEEAFASTCRQLVELFVDSRGTSTVCCLRMLACILDSRSPMEACRNQGREIFRRPDPPDFGALGGKDPDSGLVTDILSITSHPCHPIE